MYIFRLLFILCICILFNSCNNFVMSKMEQPQIIADPDNATLVIYRGTSFEFDMVVDNYLDETFIGQTKGKSFFISKIKPGSYNLVGVSENYSCEKITVSAGKVYYVLQSIYPGALKGRNSFQSRTPDDFYSDIKELTYLSRTTITSVPINQKKYLAAIDQSDKLNSNITNKQFVNLQGF